MADQVAEKMSKSSATLTHPPRKGERFRCMTCGMEIAVNKDCRCKNHEEQVHFQCCNQEMARA